MLIRLTTPLAVVCFAMAILASLGQHWANATVAVLSFALVIVTFLLRRHEGEFVLVIALARKPPSKNDPPLAKIDQPEKVTQELRRPPSARPKGSKES